MSRGAIAAAIERVRHAASRVEARSLARELDPVVPVLDARLRNELRLALEGWRIDAEHLRAPASLDIGQTWLLLHAGGREGLIARMAARDPRRDAHGDCPRIGPAELRGVLHALTGVAARACRQLPSGIIDGSTALEIESGSPETFAITGRSLELAAAVALASRALGAPADATCAGSALVGSDGRLEPVSHLAEKVDALRRDFPSVRTVVVAKGQDVPHGGDGISFRHVEMLDDALSIFGLAVANLRPSLLDQHVRREATFVDENKHAHTPERWKQLSLEAWESSTALARHDAEASARCRAWATLFLVHAGEVNTAEELAKGQDPRVLESNPPLNVWSSIAKATGLIDLDRLLDAEAFAREAVTLVEHLERHDRRRLLGQALGTLGRALMHAGRTAKAEPLLRRAADHHRAEDPREHARSLSYVATCLRQAGRASDALEIIDAAIASNDEHLAFWQVAQTTKHYLHLERGRILLALGAYEDAERELLAVMPTADVASYPRIGAERSLVRLRLRAGDVRRAREAFERCLQAADVFVHRFGSGTTLSKVAAVGVMDGVSGLALDAAERSAAMSVVEQAFGTPITPERVAAFLASWIF